MLAKEALHIGKLKYRGKAEPTVQHGILETGLAALELVPPQLPPSAILVIRKMDDPLPGKYQAVPGNRVDNSTWEKAVRNHIGGVYEKAQRPVQGSLPFDADAVLFTDPAELYACLLLDMAGNKRPDNWWWTVLGRLVPGTDRMSLLPGITGYLPAVLHTLYQWRRSGEVLQALSYAEARQLVEALGVFSGINNLLGEIRKSRKSVQAAHGEQQREQQGGPVPEFVPGHAGGAALPGDFSRYLARGNFSELVVRLPAEKMLLLVTGLVLHQAPALLHNPQGCILLKEWWRDLPEPDWTVETQPTVTAQESRDQLGKDEKENRQTSVVGNKKDFFHAKTSEKVNNDNVDPGVGDSFLYKHIKDPVQEKQRREAITFSFEKVGERVQPYPRSGQEHPGVDKQEEARDVKMGVSADKRSDLTGRQVPGIPCGEDKTTTQAEAENATGAGKENARPGVREIPENMHLTGEKTGSLSNAGAGINSKLCALFYLVNVLGRLDFFSGYEDDGGLTIQTGAWGVLEIVARAMLSIPGKMGIKAICSDPLWLVLAGLAGREPHTLPCYTGSWKGIYRITPQALLLMGSGNDNPLYWTEYNGWVYAWSDRGVVLVAMRKGKIQAVKLLSVQLAKLNLRTDALREQPGVLPPLALLKGKLIEPLDESVKHWLRLALPLVNAYITSIFTEGGFAAGEPGELLLTGAGRIYPSSSHIDIVFPLEKISLAARIAGLDRDPGWVAELGRIIYFHFT